VTAAGPFRLDGRIALVIGGTSGIGGAIADGFRNAGARVLVAGRTQAKLPPKDAYLADVTDIAQLKSLFERVVADHGRIDILVNSQGILRLKPAEEFDAADWDDVIGTNLESVFFACIEAGRHMLARGSGVIINIASLASYRGWRGSALYAISKAGVVNLTETLAAEWAGRGVRVNAIAPGFVLTDMNRDKMSAERKERAVTRTPMGRFGETGDMAGAAVYLASDAASFVTGETIRVDGGFLAAGL
jgi:NAD(P)-dependent dehydrogenase (short-subunit alcohol dehydrogenase family)